MIMIFLIQYDRQLGQIIKISEFNDADKQVAEDTRLDLEIQLAREGNTNEIVLLEASSQEALKKTHARYFIKDIKKLLISTSSLSSANMANVLDSEWSIIGGKTNYTCEKCGKTYTDKIKAQPSANLCNDCKKK